MRLQGESKKVAPYDFQRYFHLGWLFLHRICTFIGNLYPHMCTDFRLFILTFNEMVLNLSWPPIIFTVSSLDCSAGNNKKVQQSWQTSALAIHLPLARLVSMPVIFSLLPSSSIVILVFYLFSTGSDQILTQNDLSRSFKVIRFGVNEEPLRGYIVQYNNCGLECEGSEDIASERSENRHLRRPQCHLTPPL